MKTLWAFGDSYTVGHELGTGISYEDMTRWLKDNVGVSSIDVARSKWTGQEYAIRVSYPWYQHINNSVSKELSYTGLIASELSANYINKAECGVGMDFCYKEIMRNQHNINWDEDIVILGVPPFNRWLNSKGEKLNYNKVPANDFLPYEEIIISWNMALLKSLQTKFPLLYTIDLGQNKKKIDFNLEVMYSNKVNINDMADATMFGRYIGLHPTEQIHSEFADYLMENVI